MKFIALFLTTCCYGTLRTQMIPVRYDTGGMLSEVLAETKNTEIPFVATFNYTAINSIEVSNEITVGMGKACYFEEDQHRDFWHADENVVLTQFKEVELRQAKIRNFRVENSFKLLNPSVVVDFHTSWDAIEGANFSDLITATEQGGLEHVLFFTQIDPDSVGNVSANGKYATDCKNKEYFKTERYLCNHKLTFEEKIVNTQAFYLDGECVIPYEAKGQNYIDLWMQGAGATLFRKRCMLGESTQVSYDDWRNTDLKTKYPDYFPCHVAHGKNTRKCKDSFKLNHFLTNGKGRIQRLTIGKSFSNDTYDLNFTISFERWTFDFVKVFGNSFTFCNYDLDNTVLKIKMHTTVPVIPPPRGVPPTFWVWLFFMIAPATMIITALVFCIVTRSNKGFVPTVWEYWIRQKTEEKLAIEKEEAAREEAEEKEEEVKSRDTHF